MAKGKVLGSLFRAAGDDLGKFLSQVGDVGGGLGQTVVQGALNLGAEKLAPGVAQKELPKLFRSSAQSILPRAGRVAGTGLAYGGLIGAAGMLDQQSEYSQPMSNSVGNAEIDRFLMKQALQQQQFQHSLALEQARAEARTPGAQYGGSLLDYAKAEQALVEAGEVTNREAKDIARSIYGTGLRAY
tara:strand:+ start:399 stop:956 length:558 start_codon:yes stop_codon:yes gene_type:complete